jgi:2-oxoglutarate ferredoxin oxidoreductase subunit gamma
MEQDRIEMRFCGFGGQGVVLGSIIYGTALAKEGYNVIQSQVYGIEARGGASSGEAIYSNKPINHLHVTQPDILLAMSQKALDKFIDTVKPGSTVICDSFYIDSFPKRQDIQLYKAPLTEIAITELGKELFANALAMGFVDGIVQNVSKEHLVEALLESIGNKAVEQNRKAIELGYEAAQKALAEKH